LALEEKNALLTSEVHADLHEQLVELFPPQFLTAVPWNWLRHYPRFLDAIQIRLQKYFHGGALRDNDALAELSPRWRTYQQRRAEHERRGVCDPELATYRWMFEELRVSQFAQQLGTSLTVSLKRLDKQWEKVA
jgi:ATP-dependent helicase HrpA